MPRKEKDSSKPAVLKSVFLTGSVKRMKDIEKLYPTYFAKLLGMNHSRYTNKLLRPERFTAKQIHLLAEHIGIDPHIISDIIYNQITADKKKKKRASLK